MLNQTLTKLQNPVNFLYRVPILDLDLQPQHSCCCHSIAAAHVCSSQRLTAPEFQYIFQFATVLQYCAAEIQKEYLKQKKKCEINL